LPGPREIDASVVIPTHNRAPLLDRVLESFARQTADRSVFEVVVVDDGSTDETEAVWRAYADRLDTRYVRTEQGGSGAAKNTGIAAARGRLIVLADDDDLAAPELVAEHVRVHEAHPGTEVGVLGYGTWDPALPVTELMHFVTEVGQFLSSYRTLREGDVLDFEHFWSGRVSVKRELLLESGGFDSELAALEDVELGYRLSERGLRIVFTRRAVNYMLRSFDFDAFCRRCERTGRGLARFRILHPGPVADRYEAMLLGSRAKQLTRPSDGSQNRQEALGAAERRVETLRPDVLSLEKRLERGRVRFRPSSPVGRLSRTRRRLYRLYDDAFRASILKGALAAVDTEAT
jgi:glycosyltransferase involved in cell wall biosynthesis